MSSTLFATLNFTNYDASIAIKTSNSKLGLRKADQVIGWSEFSIIKKFGNEGASQWVEGYTDDVVISQEGSQDPTTILIVSNSNAINYGIKNNSNAIVNLPGSGAFTEQEKADLLEDVRTQSNAFVYCCKNVSNSLTYGLKNNSNAIVALLPGAFSEAEKLEALEDIRTTSNAFLYCCKNVSNALVYGIRTNSNAITDLLEGEFTLEERVELLEDIRTTSNAFLYCCRNTSNALVYGIRANSNAITSLPLKVCGCSSECEPVARAQDIQALRDARYARPQGERGRGRALPVGSHPGEVGSHLGEVGSHPGVGEWSSDNKYLAMIKDHGSCDGVLVYAYDHETDELTRIAHVRVADGVYVYSVAWGDDGQYLAIGIEENKEEEVYVYEFDKTAQTLRLLPGMDKLLKGF